MERVYYVSAQDGARYSLMLGPFATHEAALAQVDAVCAKACQLDPRAWFWAWGTLSALLDRKGTMNRYFPELMEDSNGA